MAEKKQKPEPKVKLTEHEKLARLVERQRKLDAQIKRIEKVKKEREEKAANARRSEVLALVEQAGILDLSDEVLTAGFAGIKNQQGV